VDFPATWLRIQKFCLQETFLDRFCRKGRDPVLRLKTDRDLSGFVFDWDHDRDRRFKIVTRLRNAALLKSLSLVIIHQEFRPDPIWDKAGEESSGLSTRGWPQWRRSFLTFFSKEHKKYFCRIRAAILLLFGYLLLEQGEQLFLPEIRSDH